MHEQVILSFFKKTKIWNCPKGGAFVHSFKAPRRGDWGFCILAMLIPYSSQPPPNQFSCLSQNTLQKDQESPHNELQWLEQKYLKILHGIVVNPLSPNIHLQILQTDLHTFPLRISWETLINNLGIFSSVIISLILITLFLDNVWILLAENWCWSLLGERLSLFITLPTPNL